MPVPHGPGAVVRSDIVSNERYVCDTQPHLRGEFCSANLPGPLGDVRIADSAAPELFEFVYNGSADGFIAVELSVLPRTRCCWLRAHNFRARPVF